MKYLITKNTESKNIHSHGKIEMSVGMTQCEEFSEEIARFDNLDDAKKALGKYNCTYSLQTICGMLAYDVTEYYIEAWEVDEDGDLQEMDGVYGYAKPWLDSKLLDDEYSDRVIFDDELGEVAKTTIEKERKEKDDDFSSTIEQLKNFFVGKVIDFNDFNNEMTKFNLYYDDDIDIETVKNSECIINSHYSVIYAKYDKYGDITNYKLKVIFFVLDKSDKNVTLKIVNFNKYEKK